MNTTRTNKRGAKKGENRFENSQKSKINYRLQRIRNVVLPKIKAISKNTHFKNVTSFRKLCAELYNSELPIDEKKISYRTLGNRPYWDELGAIFYSFFNDVKIPIANSMVTSLKLSDEIDKLKIQLAEKTKELTLMESVLLNSPKINPLSNDVLTTSASPQAEINTSKDDIQYIDDFAAIINWLIERSDDVIFIDKDSQSIIDLSDDLNGTLDRKISRAFFMYMKGELHSK